MLEKILDLSASILLFSGVILYLFAVFTKVVLDPLRRVPGPLLARFTRFWYLYNIWQGKFERVNIDLHKKYGPVVRIAPNEYSIDDLDAAKIIYGHGNAFSKVRIAYEQHRRLS